MIVLVTGGAGFIGSCLARRLLAEGHKVVVIDNLRTGHRSNLPDGAIFVEGDIGRPETLTSLPKLPYDAVCHLAAQSSGAISMDEPLYDFQTNAVSTVLLAGWCRQHNVRRLVYASSMAVYGSPPSLPVTEASPLNPISYYGVSKLASEHVLRLAAAGGVETTALRMFNVYGPGQNMANLRQGMASIYLAYLLKAQTVPVTGSLERFRDFVYIDDIIDAWLAVLMQPTTPSPVYNLGSGDPTTVRELITLLIEACGLDPGHPVREEPSTQGDQFGLFADCSLATRDFGWRAGTSLPEGLKRMVEYVKRDTRSLSDLS